MAWRCTWKRAVTTFFFGLLLAAACAAVATTYRYDPEGRLVVATNSSGESARYHYDELGNIAKVDRLAASELAVFDFYPGRGSAGLTVRVHGRGFSQTTALNTVAFGGVAAEVTAASESQLTVIVPTGASSGPITVSMGGQTAVSSSSFIVDNDVRPPAIAGVTPVIAKAGSVINVVGQDFLPLAHQTTFLLNQKTVRPTTLTNVQSVFPIPAGVGSGRVTVTTPYGIDHSDQSVLVLPGIVSIDDIASVKRLIVDSASEAFSASTVEQQSAVLFDGGVGEYLSAQFDSISVDSISYELYGTENNLLLTGDVTPYRPTVHFPRLPSSGTYLLLLKSAQAPATWNMALETDAKIISNESSLLVGNAFASQSKRLAFQVMSGQHLGLGISQMVLSGGYYVIANIYKPDGSFHDAVYCYESDGGCDVNLSGLTNGTYTLVLEPYSGAMSLQATLSADAEATIERGSVYELALERRGQNGRLTFSASAGETLALQVTGQVTAPAGHLVYYTVVRPNGTTLASGMGTLNLPNLPVTGNYRVIIDPRYGSEVEAQVRLVDGVTGSISIDGEIGSFSTPIANQGAYLSFMASAGQNIGLGLFEITPNEGDYLYISITVFSPDGLSIGSTSCNANEGECDLNLKATTAGLHRVAVEPATDGGGFSFKLAATSDATGTLSSGVPMTVNLDRRGQNGRYTFDGVAGGSVALQIVGDRLGPVNKKGLMNYSVYKPDGTLLLMMDYQAAAIANFSSLPQTGSYTIFLDPVHGAAAMVQLSLTPGVSEQLNGAGGSYATQIPGQRAYLVYEISAGQKLGFGIYDLAAGTSSVWLTHPSGSVQCYVSNQGCDINIAATQSGTYVVELGPSSAVTMSFKTLLSSDVTGVLQRNVLQHVELTRRGSNARLTFSATAGESLSLQTVNHSSSPAQVGFYCTVYTPSGQVWRSTWLHVGTTLSLSGIPSTGTYVVFLDPSYGVTISSDIRLTGPAL